MQVSHLASDRGGVGQLGSTPACAWNDHSGLLEARTQLLHGVKKELDIHVPLS